MAPRAPDTLSTEGPPIRHVSAHGVHAFERCDEGSDPEGPSRSEVTGGGTPRCEAEGNDASGSRGEPGLIGGVARRATPRRIRSPAAGLSDSSSTTLKFCSAVAGSTPAPAIVSRPDQIGSACQELSSHGEAEECLGSGKSRSSPVHELLPALA